LLTLQLDGWLVGWLVKLGQLWWKDGLRCRLTWELF